MYRFCYIDYNKSKMALQYKCDQKHFTDVSSVGNDINRKYQIDRNREVFLSSCWMHSCTKFETIYWEPLRCASRDNNAEL